MAGASTFYEKAKTQTNILILVIFNFCLCAKVTEMLISCYSI